jgi:pRiA4b ORF-3-like protein
MSAATVARLKITLDGVKPAVLRRVEVPFDIRLDRLHLTIQAAMGWTNSHLYELRARDVGWSTPFPTSMGEATSSTPARPASTTCSKTSARRR